MTEPFKLENIVIKDFIGQGKYGRVHICCTRKENSSTVLYHALKVINRESVSKTKTQIQHIFAEKECLKACADCKYTVNLIQTLKDEKNLYFLLELVRGEPLYVVLKDPTRLIQNHFKIQKRIGYEILLALEFVHNKGFVYRDLKASNVLLNCDGHVKLIDFGFSKKIADNQRATTFLGTLHAMAPEILCEDVCEYGYEVDYWAYGVLMYELFIGEPPYVTKSREEMFNVANTSYNEVLENEFQSISERQRKGGNNGSYFESNLLDLKDMLKNIWKQIPNERLGYVNGFEEIKKHSYFSNFLNVTKDQNEVTSMAMDHLSPSPLLLELICNSKTSVYKNDLFKTNDEIVDQQMFKGF